MDLKENNELKKQMTDIFLKHLESHNPGVDFYVAGGAPRDWYFNRKVNDVDIYLGKEAKLKKQVIKQAFIAAGIAVNSVFTNDKTTTSSYRGRVTQNPNTAIKKVTEVNFGLRTNSGYQNISFDVIRLHKLDSFSDIFKTYDCDICMIGYKDGSFYLSQLFRDFDQKFRKGVSTFPKINTSISKDLLDYAKQKHFPKIKKKYPEICGFDDYFPRQVEFQVTLMKTIPTIPSPKTLKQPTWRQPESIKPAQKNCSHKWNATLLVFNMVYDCKLCGMKKEDYKEKPKLTW